MSTVVLFKCKELTPYLCLDGHAKEPYDISMAWEPDRRSNFFFSHPNLFAVTCLTEMILIVTLNKQLPHSL